MSFSQADICNLALGHLGVTRLIEDLDTDTTTQAQAIRTQWDLSLAATLKARPWPFARRLASLASITNTSNVWAYAYRLPADYLLALALNRIDGDPIGERYEISADATGGILFANVDEADLEYTALITSTGLYPVDFVDALSFKIAERIAHPLAASDALREGARRGFRSAINEAMANAGNEAHGQQPQTDPFTAART